MEFGDNHIKMPLKGEYKGRKYHIMVRPDPSQIDRDPKEIEEFCIAIYFINKKGEREQIVRIDTAHGQVHIDKLYSEREDIKNYFDNMSFMEAWQHLQQNWKKFAKLYDQKEK
jgi:hypothetical protein